MMMNVVVESFPDNGTVTVGTWVGVGTLFFLADADDPAAAIRSCMRADNEQSFAIGDEVHLLSGEGTTFGNYVIVGWLTGGTEGQHGAIIHRFRMARFTDNPPTKRLRAWEVV